MEHKKGAVEVIAKILGKIPENEQIRVIQQNYHGMPAIEYDIKSCNGIIVKVKEYDTYVRTSEFTNYVFCRLF